ncbi:MAG: hypothetical protein GF409_05475 [Candidatus Omnitrophica bacterium]|nr:hypothetical protein [Candidatus Omnitrophota bacterium]
MKRIFNWRVGMALALIALSAALYYTHFRIFHDAHHIFIYLLGDIAFVPVEVLLVTLIIHHLLEKREKRHLLNKMNMLIGTFFSDVGTDLLRIFSGFDRDSEALKKALRPDSEWTHGDFDSAKKLVSQHGFSLSVNAGELVEVRDLLSGKRNLLMNLLANPNLLEHDSFTDLLWAVFHLAEELQHRDDLAEVPETDLEHLAGDVERAYGQLLYEWIDYMRHLSKSYPYLFSLAMRTNPFKGRMTAEVH